MDAIGNNGLFMSAALPDRVFPPLFNRYDAGAGHGFDSHVDNAIRYLDDKSNRIRTDLSATLFLADPDDYDGGELIVEDTYGEHAVKLPVGAKYHSAVRSYWLASIGFRFGLPPVPVRV